MARHAMVGVHVLETSPPWHGDGDHVPVLLIEDGEVLRGFCEVSEVGTQLASLERAQGDSVWGELDIVFPDVLDV